MAAYLVGHISVRNKALWRQYIAGVAESLTPFEARVVFRGQLASVLAGEQEHELIVVIEFADNTSLQAWFDSDKYQSIIPLRDEAADVIISTYESYD